MKVVYSFHGKLPSYSVTTVKQLRFFFEGDIYFIISDMKSQYIDELRKMNVHIVDYNTVEDCDFTNLQKKFYKRFCYCELLTDREELFLRSIERFYLLHNLMVKENLTDVFFVELDNLIYNNPDVWYESFSKKEIAYMIDNRDVASSGICYVKRPAILKSLMELFSYKIEFTEEFLSEMRFLFEFWKNNMDSVQILPTHWESLDAFSPTYENYESYENSIFDSLPMGIFLTGSDPVHTDGKIVLGTSSKWSINNYTSYRFFWKPDDKNRYIPYVSNGPTTVRINNLHVHSKNMEPFTSDIVKA